MGTMFYDRAVSLPQRLFLSWIIDSLALAAAAWIFSGVYGSPAAVIGAALVFGLLTTFLKPALKFVTFLIALVTLGLAWFGVSMFILWLTSKIVSGFHIEGFWTLVGATIVVWAVGSIGARWLFPPKKQDTSGTIEGRFKRA
jgi:putative membrane protein